MTAQRAVCVLFPNGVHVFTRRCMSHATWARMMMQRADRGTPARTFWRERLPGAATAVSVITTLYPGLLQLRHPILRAHLRSVQSATRDSPTLPFIMSNNNRYYYSLPTQPPQHQRSGSRRPPLTPSVVSSPCLTTHAPIATRRDSGSGSPTKASALLAKVASNPATPRNETPSVSPLPSPTSRPVDLHSSPLYTPERPAVWRSESARYVRQYKQQGTQSRSLVQQGTKG